MGGVEASEVLVAVGASRASKSPLVLARATAKTFAGVPHAQVDADARTGAIDGG